MASKVVETYENIIKSERDKISYRGLLLSNGLKCLLMSDPDTDRSSASVNVKVGYMSDPAEFPGLAHFCEHMLFMGSKKYPLENHFQKFIADHAGFTNAFTEDDATCYYFSVGTDHFKDALDMYVI